MHFLDLVVVVVTVYSVCVRARHDALVVEIRRQLSGVSSCPPPWRSWGLDSDCYSLQHNFNSWSHLASALLSGSVTRFHKAIEI